jgi:hypothetical protein
MNIRHYVDSEKLCFRLLVLLLICGITTLWLKTYSCKRQFVTNIENSAVVRQKYDPDCPVFDPQATPQHLFQAYFSVLNNSLWLARSALYSPLFQELHSLLFGSAAPNLYETWPNYFKVKIDLSYPHTSLTQPLFTTILREINIPVTFLVEVGSFTGKSSINIVRTMLNSKLKPKFVLLCIDTWLGGLEHWTEEQQRQLMGIQYGRPVVYEQFIANIVANNLTKYVIPFSTTSILGARFLLEKKLFPQIIYLDSAHLQGETYVELELYWLLIQDGGILIGDDWSWTSVRCDVTRFIEHIQANVTVIGNTWFIKKKISL